VLREVDQLRQERAARDIQSKFYDLRESKGLTEAELMSFANKIDDANINLLAHPDVDLEYLYFKLSNDDIVQKRIQAAVEDAVRKVTKAGAQSSTPSKQIGKSSEEPMAINTMAGLNDLLDKK
jgi:nucleoside-diphosphate-sugar epimerase